MATLTHLGMLARMSDQDSHNSVRPSRCWQEQGLSPMREVSSAYCRMIESTRAFITVLKIVTDNVSPQ